MSRKEASWIDEENSKAAQQAHVSSLPNEKAPQLVRAKKASAPTRNVRGFYVQEGHSIAFDKLVFSQKAKKGKKAPELIEEAIELLLKKYDEDFNL